MDKLFCFSSSPVSEGEKQSVQLVINPHDGQRSVFRRTTFPLLCLGYNNWDFLTQLDELEERVEESISELPELRAVLFTGMCKDSLSSLVLALRIRRRNPDLRIGVWGCAWAADYSGETPSCKGVSLSPVHEYVQKKEPYKTLLKKWGDPLRLLEDPAARSLHLFAFYCRHSYWTMDEEATQRLASWLTMTYVHDADSDYTMAEVHTKILNLTRCEPERVSFWIKDMFRLMDSIPPG